MSDFEALLAQINAVGEEQDLMAKSLSSDPKDNGAADNKIADADAEDKNPEDAEDDKIDDDTPMTKSMNIDGEVYQIADADELIKSMAQFGDRLSGQEKILSTALESVLNVMNTQSSLIKSLNDKVERLSGSPMRKSIIAVAERPSVADQGRVDKGQEKPQLGELMAKSSAAFAAGKLSGLDAARIENYIQSGCAIPADLLAKIS